MTPSRRRIALRRGRVFSAGFSMIEVLIAIVVLALGLLGFALLQTMNLRYTQSANYRTQATNLAYDLLDQMRANNLTAAAYAAATFAPGTVSGADCTRPTAVITVAQSIARWQCQVVEALGAEASATVTYIPGIGTANVTIVWDERLDTDATFEVETQL